MEPTQCYITLALDWIGRCPRLSHQIEWHTQRSLTDVADWTWQGSNHDNTANVCAEFHTHYDQFNECHGISLILVG